MPVLAIVLVLAVAAAAVVYVPRLATSSSRDSTLSECHALQAQLAAMGQGADPTTRASVQAQLDDCVRRAQAQGLNIDASSVKLFECDASASQIDAEWGNYRTTVDSDAIKRNNTRGTMLRLGGELAALYGEAIADATTPDALNLIRLSILKSIRASIARERCFLANEGGCSRFGVNEPEQGERASDEHTRVFTPLVGAYDACVAKLYAAPPGGVGSAADVPSGNPYGRLLPGSVLCERVSLLCDLIAGEFAAYATVDSGDVLQRENKRGHWLDLEAGLAAALRLAVDRMNGHDDVAAVNTVALRVNGDQTARYQTFVQRVPGWKKGDFSLEPDDATKAAAEKVTLDQIVPLSDYVRSVKAGNDQADAVSSFFGSGRARSVASTLGPVGVVRIGGG